MDGAIDLNESEGEKLDDERTEVLEQLEDWLETPMVVLGFVWLLILIVDLIWGLNSFLLLNYLKVNWITAISLLVPAIRVLRAVRIVRAMGRRRFSYVLMLTLIVTLSGAAGMYAFERERHPRWVLKATAQACGDCHDHYDGDVLARDP